MQRLVVIGWDCSDFRLIMPWIKQGYLPNLQKLMNVSKHGILKSIDPPVTPVAWSTIVTGRNPGKHGVSGFMSFRPGSYEARPCSSSDRHGKDVWELLSDYGKKVAVIGVPLTFPVRKVNGCMISGLLTPNELVDYCYPRELKQEILSKIPGYATIPSNFSRNFSDFSSNTFDEESVRSVFDILEKHIQATLYIAGEKQWDFLMAVFNETDWVQHRFWSCIDKKHPKYDQKRAEKYENVIRDVHIRLDEALGRLSRIVQDANIMLISDHGVGPLYWNVSTNYILYKMRRMVFKRSPETALRLVLARLGLSTSKIVTVMTRLQLSFAHNTSLEHGNQEVKDKSARAKINTLSLAKALSRSLILSYDDIDWSKTVAFARMGHGEIYLNRENIFPKGIIKESEYNKVRSELIKELQEIKNGKDSVIEHAFSKDDLYAGEYFEDCPDIQLRTVEGYVATGGFTFGLKRGFVVPEASYAGHHSMNGIIVLKEIGFESSARTIEGAQLVDIVPTILHLMQVPIPADLDGRSIADNPERPSAAEAKTEIKSAANQEFMYSKEEEENIEDHLRSLGYI